VRRIVTFRHALTGAAAASALLGTAAAPVAAAPHHTKNSIPDGIERSYEAHYHKVKKLGGKPGRDLVHDGIRKHGHARAARPGEVKRSIRVLKRMAIELTAPAPAPTPAPVSASAPATSGSSSARTTTSTAGTTGSTAPSGAASGAGGSLGGIAACESGGNPSAVGGGGTYRGKYQFDQQTWQSVGGSGDPAAAPEAEQDARAAQLYSQRGAQAWPTCGK
jgi:hypothetical protein